MDLFKYDINSKCNYTVNVNCVVDILKNQQRANLKYGKGSLRAKNVKNSHQELVKK